MLRLLDSSSPTKMNTGTRTAPHTKGDYAPAARRYTSMSTTMTRWTATTAKDYDRRTCKDVYSAVRENVGKIKDVYHPEGDFKPSQGGHFFLLDPGLLRDRFGGFDKVYLPESSIENATQDRVTVGYTKDQIKNLGS